MSINLVDSSQAELDDFETKYGLKVLDYIPVVSTVSGVARIAFGLLQYTAACVIGVRSVIHELLDSSCDSGLDYADKLLLTGKVNMIRGSVAGVPILGNIGLYLYDQTDFAKNLRERFFV